jgi:hypothetical protein
MEFKLVPRDQSQTTPLQHPLTPEFFARARQSLAKREADLTEKFRQVNEEIRALNEEITRIDADEKLATDLSGSLASLVARYEPAIAAELPKKRGPHRLPTPSRPVPSGRPWTPDEEVFVLAGDPKNDEALAKLLDRKPGSIEKRRRKILRDRPPAVMADAAPRRSPDVENEPVDLIADEADDAVRRGSLSPAPSHPERAAAVEPDRQYDADATTGCADDQSELGEAVAADAGLDPSSSQTPEIIEPSEAQPALPFRPWAASFVPSISPEHSQPIDREDEIKAIARFEDERGITLCPAPGSAEFAALPSPLWNNKTRKWARSE